MKLIEIVYHIQNDFWGIYECENCHVRQKRKGYMDANFEINVIPNYACPSCGKTTKELEKQGVL